MVVSRTSVADAKAERNATPAQDRADDGNASHARSFSRGRWSSEVCMFPLHERGKRSADRRSGAAAPVGGRMTYARRRQRGRPTSHDAGRSPLGAPPRRLLAPDPPWRNLRALHMSGALGSRIGAFARSARNGGRAVLPGASRGAVTSRARRTPHPAPTLARLRRRPR